MKLDIKIVPQEQQRFTTIGYWEDDGENVIITISQMSDWRFIIAVLFHELIELFWCRANSVTQAQCDEWDESYEKLYKSGEKDLTEEPGDDPNCPYFDGHQWGGNLEWLVVKVLRASWKDYLKDCDRLMGTEYSK